MTKPPLPSNKKMGHSSSDFDLPPDLLENLQAAYVVHDKHTQIIDWNLKSLELLGLNADQILGKKAMDPHWHFVNEAGEVLEASEYPVNLVLSQKQAISDYIIGIVSSMHKDIVWVQVSAVPIINDKAEITHVFVTFMDVSERVQALQIQRENEQRFRAVITAMHEGLVVQKQNGEITTCNPAAEQVLGLTALQICGRKSIDKRWKAIRENGDVFPGEEHPAMVTLRTGKPQNNVIMGIQKPNGELSWISINTAPIFEGEKLPTSVVSTFSDITGLLSTQQRLVSNTKFLSSIIDGVDDGLCVCHATEAYPYVQFTVWNDQMTKVTGYSMEQINELGWYQSLYPDTELQQKAIERMQSMREGDDIRYEEWPIIRADGTKRTISIATRLLGAQNEEPSVLGLMQDVTEARQAEKKLRDSEALFRGLIESSPIAMLVVTADEAFKVLNMNKKFTQLFGWTLKDIPDVSQWWPKAYPDAKYREQVQLEWQQRVESAQAEGTSQIESMEARVTCKNKEVRNIEFHMAMLGDKAIVIFNDLTLHLQAQESMRQSAAIIDNTSEGVMVTDTKLRIVTVNRAFTEITGYTIDDIKMKHPSCLSSDRHKKTFFKSMQQSLEQEGNWQGEIYNKRKNGEIYPEWLTFSSIYDDEGKVINYVGIFSDITSVKKSEEKLYFLAHHDQLTELPNRFHFDEHLKHTIQRASRDKLSFAVFFIDLDRFKHINDSFGHPTGDKVLLKTAIRISATLRKKDIVARLGGDEFIVLIEDEGNINKLTSIAKKIIKTISAPVTVDNNVFYLSASIGIATYPDNGTDVTTLISNADAAMYRAKEEGRNTFQFYTRDMTESAMERVVLESDLRSAIQNNELAISLQPIYKNTGVEIAGAEVLVRWQHKTRGFVPPEKFIPLAEECGLIDAISTFVLQQACDVINEINQSGLKDLTISVNLSASQLHKPGMLDGLLDIVKNYKIPMKMLEFELTETIFAYPSDELIQELKKIRKLNISLAVDDFGTGFSSLVYLKRFPLDKLKIDRSFVGDIPDDENDMAITKAIIALGKSLQLDIVAEGVETKVQEEFLKSEGCEYLQGFLYSKPVSFDEFKKILNI